MAEENANKDEEQKQAEGKPDAAQQVKRLQGEIETLKAQLAEANGTITTLNENLEKALTEDDVKAAVEKAKAEAEAAQKEASTAAAAREKRLVVENELIKANCIDTTGALAHVNLDEVEIASDGHVSGLDVAQLAEAHKHLFQQPNTDSVSSAGTPNGSGKAMTKKEIMAIKDPAKRHKAIAENFELFE